MLKSDIEWPKTRSYDTGTEWEPIGFFSDCLCNSTSFDLMLGFFASSAISLLADGFATFLYNGGKMRLIINDILSNEDKKAILKGESQAFIPIFDLSNIQSIKDSLSERNKHFFDCLAWLIRNNRIEIKIIAPNSGTGISHPKCGVFFDGKNYVAFTGSCNFSQTALIDNIENITAFCDWDEGPSADTVQARIEHFDKTFEGKGSYRYISPEAIKTQILNNFENQDLNNLLKKEQDIIAKHISSPNLSKSAIASLRRAQNRVEDIMRKDEEKRKELEIQQSLPHFPYSTGPRPYQIQAFENWKNNNQQGLFAMATGTGKTITSLNCLLEIYKRKGYYKAIILVPTVTLVDQWEKECRKFNFNNIIKVCSKYSGWKNDISSIKTLEQISDRVTSYIIISTYASFIRDNIFNLLNELSASQVLLIADEAHNMGAASLKKKLPTIQIARRIGLSATPERQFDEEGNLIIEHFFGVENSQYTFEYSMKEAIEKGVLCKYLYYPHLIELTDEEMLQYEDISKKIVKYFNFNKCTFDKSDEILTGLLLKRKRIIHKAFNKQLAFKKILEERIKQQGNLKYTLVYVPEGNKPDNELSDIFTKTDNIDEDEESLHLIDVYTSIVRDVSDTTTVRKFTSDSEERDHMLLDFEKGTIDVLTSMKCLDEGVDVPRSEVAIFCASTGNPRQFIQRRGRVLRTHKDKDMAILHDLVVAPKLATSDATFQMERAILMSELRRVNNFAMLSMNPFDTQIELMDVLKYYNLNIFNNE